MKPKSEGENMKTLNDVIKEMNEQCEIHENHLSTDNIEIYMRRVCEAMAKEIVPFETIGTIDWTDGFFRGYNYCRDKTIENIAGFMNDEKTKV